MKKLFLTILFFTSCFTSFAQDVIVLRKDEEELKCRIVAINDTIIYYRKWNTPGTAKYSYKRSEVLSYTLEKNFWRLKTYISLDGTIYFATEKVDVESRKLSKKEQKIDPNNNFLGKYLSDEVVDGYIILNSEDTLNGLLFIRNVAMNQLSVSFKGDEADRRDYDVSELKGYVYNNLNYKNVPNVYTKEVINERKSENGNLLLHQLVDGTAKLYLFFEIQYPKSVAVSYENPPAYLGKLSRYYVIENGQGVRMMNKGRSVRKTLSKLFSDDSELLKQIYAKVPKEEDLVTIINSYNERHPVTK